MIPSPQAPGSAEEFVFGNAGMRVMAGVFGLLVPLLWLGSALLLVLAVAEGLWGLLWVAGGVALMAPLSAGQARAYRQTIGQRMRVDARGISLPDAGVLLPWDGMDRITQRRDPPKRGSWRYVEFLPRPDQPELLDSFRRFNENLPSALGPLAGGSAGFVVDMLSAPARDHPRLNAALDRFAPDLVQPRG